MGIIYLLTPRGISCLDLDMVIDYLTNVKWKAWSGGDKTKVRDFFKDKVYTLYQDDYVKFCSGSFISTDHGQVSSLDEDLFLFSKEGLLISPEFYQTHIIGQYLENEKSE